MNRTTLFLFASLIFLLNCPASRGQGCFTPHFNVYTSVARDGNSIYTAVSISGSTTVLCSGMSGSVTHKAGARNVISNTGGWTYSGSNCPSCYYSVTGYDTFVGVPGI